MSRKKITVKVECHRTTLERIKALQACSANCDKQIAAVCGKALVRFKQAWEKSLKAIRKMKGKKPVNKPSVSKPDDAAIQAAETITTSCSKPVKKEV